MLGRYEILRELGRGGTSVVYDAYDHLLGARVALKRIVGATPGTAARMRRVLRSSLHLCHPNVVSLGEVFRGRDAWFLTMELVEGTDMRSFLRADRARLRSAFVQMAKALHALHSAGIVHRDVKPSNVIVTREGRVVLVDMGLSTAMSAAADGSTGSGLGTPAYMAPEQATAKFPGPSLDWYAFGVMLYESLTGALPFEGDGLSAILNKRTMAPPSPELAPHAPRDLGDLALKLMAIDPALRPSGDEVLAHLGATREPVVGVMDKPFIGRSATLVAMFDALEHTPRSAPVVRRVLGAWGSGRRTLLSRFARIVEQRGTGAMVVEVGGNPREHVRLAIVDGILDALGQETSSALDTGEHSADEWASVLADALRRAAGNRPILLLASDADWLDPESQSVLRKLAKKSEAAPMLVVVSAESRRGLPTARGGGADIELGPLSIEDSTELSAHLLQAAGASSREVASVASKLALGSAGHLGLLDQLVAHSVVHGCASDCLEKRLSLLSDGALALAVGTGRAIRQSALHPLRILPALHELEAAFVARPGATRPDVLRPSHPRVMRAAREVLQTRPLLHIAP